MDCLIFEGDRGGLADSNFAQYFCAIVDITCTIYFSGQTQYFQGNLTHPTTNTKWSIVDFILLKLQ